MKGKCYNTQKYIHYKVSYLPLLGLRFGRRSWNRVDKGWCDWFTPLSWKRSLIVLLGGCDTILTQKVYAIRSSPNIKLTVINKFFGLSV